MAWFIEWHDFDQRGLLFSSLSPYREIQRINIRISIARVPIFGKERGEREKRCNTFQQESQSLESLTTTGYLPNNNLPFEEKRDPYEILYQGSSTKRISSIAIITWNNKTHLFQTMSQIITKLVELLCKKKDRKAEIYLGIIFRDK